jgi:hypothetical protein
MGGERARLMPLARRLGVRLLAFACVSAAAAGCGGASPESSVTAGLRLSGRGVQYVPGPLDDDPAAVGPAVHAISAAFHVAPGASGRTVSGTVEQGSSAVLIGLVGDVGHYIVPVSGVDTDNLPDLQFAAQASFSRALAPGSAILRARAVSASDGAIGPAATQALSIDAEAPSGTLVISLAWDTEADLDLHVVTPSPTPGGKPVELWTGNRTTLLPRSALDGGPYSDEELAQAGILDFDSNSQCVIDGKLIETASWQLPPPAGHYIVRVDTFSMCGQAAARWTLTATLNGESIAGTYAGVSTDWDTRYPHKAGAGLNVLEFDL